MTEPDVCPFCAAKRRTPTSVAWRCGTYQDGTDDDGEETFATGHECDLVCFRDGFLRCLALLREVANSGIEHKLNGYWVVQLSNNLMDEIMKEIK